MRLSDVGQNRQAGTTFICHFLFWGKENTHRARRVCVVTNSGRYRLMVKEGDGVKEGGGGEKVMNAQVKPISPSAPVSLLLMKEKLIISVLWNPGRYHACLRAHTHHSRSISPMSGRRKFCDSCVESMRTIVMATSSSHGWKQCGAAVIAMSLHVCSSMWLGEKSVTFPYSRLLWGKLDQSGSTTLFSILHCTERFRDRCERSFCFGSCSCRANGGGSSRHLLTDLVT